MLLDAVTSQLQMPSAPRETVTTPPLTAEATLPFKVAVMEAVPAEASIATAALELRLEAV
ncbi:hypothetical protein D3C72_2487550 [compost metagenome]